MRKSIISLLLFFFAGQLYADESNRHKLDLLRSYINSNQVYNKENNPDSIILWGEQLEPVLLKNKQYRELFEIKGIIAHTHAMRGDISLAINKVKTMTEEARDLHYDQGFALASHSIGDTYRYADMIPEAISSYKEALKLYDELPDNEQFKKIALRQLLRIISADHDLEEVAYYLSQFKALFSDDAEDDPSYAYLFLFEAFYHLRLDQLEEAKKNLDKAAVLMSEKDKYFSLAYLQFVTAQYYERVGEYTLAEEGYEKMSESLTSGIGIIGQNQTFTAHARLLVKLGKADEACQLYSRLNAIKDSLGAKSYARQVNLMHTNYQVDQMKLKNQAQKSNLVRSAIIVGICMLILYTLLTLYIRRGNKRLAESKIKLEKAKRHAESSIRSKSMFLSNMSHEIRTPLNALSGFSAILTEDSIDDETRLQCTEIIQQNSELLLKLINDVIDLSSLEFGKMQFNFKECDAITLCRNVVDMVQKIKQTRADILFETSLDKLMLVTDDARLQQVLINLLINATKFTPSGSITLSLSLSTKNTALFTVTDTGCGIPLENQKKIFKRFEKLDEQDQGTGLGLSICQLIIEYIGGEIWIDPDYTTGSRFCFTHPIQQKNKRR